MLKVVHKTLYYVMIVFLFINGAFLCLPDIIAMVKFEKILLIVLVFTLIVILNNIYFLEICMISLWLLYFQKVSQIVLPLS